MELINTIGRRKTSIARAYVKKGKGNITINDKDAKVYFSQADHHVKINQPFAATETENQFDAVINVKGGGITGQVEAVRMAIARALTEVDEQYKPALRAEGLLTRDPRMVERKKFGRKKARKKFQFSKR